MRTIFVLSVLALLAVSAVAVKLEVEEISESLIESEAAMDSVSVHSNHSRTDALQHALLDAVSSCTVHWTGSSYIMFVACRNMQRAGGQFGY